MLAVASSTPGKWIQPAAGVPVPLASDAFPEGGLEGDVALEVDWEEFGDATADAVLPDEVPPAVTTDVPVDGGTTEANNQEGDLTTAGVEGTGDKETTQLPDQATEQPVDTEEPATGTEQPSAEEKVPTDVPQVPDDGQQTTGPKEDVTAPSVEQELMSTIAPDGSGPDADVDDGKDETVQAEQTTAAPVQPTDGVGVTTAVGEGDDNRPDAGEHTTEEPQTGVPADEATEPVPSATDGDSSLEVTTAAQGWHQ